MSNRRLLEQQTGALPSRRGFTLVEILAATAVLLVIVLAVGRLFRDSTAVWKLGTRRQQDNAEARGVLNFIANELSHAVADGELSIRLNSYEEPVFSGASEPWWNKWWNDSISFVSLDNAPEPGSPRAAQEVIYYVSPMNDLSGDPMPGRYALMRSVRTGTNGVTCYDRSGFPNTGKRWWGRSRSGASTLVENLGSFEVWCSGQGTNASGAVNYRNIVSYNSNHDRDLMKNPGGNYIYTVSEFEELSSFQKDRLPLWLEIYVCLLSEDDAIKAAAFHAAGQYVQARSFVDRFGRRYAIRVYLGNRLGYSGDR